MISESIFRTLFAVIFFPFIIIWIWKFILSGLREKSFYTKREGIVSALLFRIFLTLSLICIFLYLFYPSVFPWFYIKIPSWIRLSGFVLGIFALILIVWALKTLGNSFFASLNLREDHQLIIKGLYRWSRHPLYLLFNLIWICFFLISANVFIGISGIAAYLVIYFGRVPREEKMMEEYFGMDYLDYKKKTKKFLPFFRK